MSQKLVTIGHYWNSVDARLAKIHLETAGIHSVLQNENSVTTNWLEVANASRGVQLQVDEADIDAAMDVLEQRTPTEGEIGNAWETVGTTDNGDNSPSPDDQSVDDDQHDPEYVSLNLREKLIQQAYVSAILGVIFLPLEFYSLNQLLLSAISDKPVRESMQKKRRWAWVINLFVILGYFLLALQITGYGVSPSIAD